MDSVSKGKGLDLLVFVYCVCCVQYMRSRGCGCQVSECDATTECVGSHPGYLLTSEGNIETSGGLRLVSKHHNQDQKPTGRVGQLNIPDMDGMIHGRIWGSH